ncbi:MAG: hypothetical protein A2X02_04055 [Bacteroidetes bacterium GWF2_29_10]|nr:MAG: hypothetical protein A2X02_04055 [Bacteroidetes bacterium GWF2_29_10]
MIKYVSLFVFVLSLVFNLSIYAQRHGGMGSNKYRGTAKTTKKVKYGSRRVSMGSRYSENENYLGLSFGALNSLTDIGGKGLYRKPFIMDVQWKNTKMSFGANFNQSLGENFKIRYGVLYGQLSGYDTLYENTSRSKRRYAFTNNIIEGSTVLQVVLPKFGGGGGSRYRGGGASSFFSNMEFYFYAGVGGIYHSPELIKAGVAVIDNSSEYKNFQVILPLGAGFNYSISSGVKLGIDIGWRKTFTDYLDGFTRPASKGNDGYFYSCFNIQFKLPESNYGRNFR